MTDTTFTHVSRPAGIAELAAATESHDGVAPLSEAFLAGASDSRLAHRHILARHADQVVGVAALDEAAGTAEMFVVPEARREGVGRALYRELPAGTQVWAHGNLPGAQALAKAEGLEKTRHLIVMAVEGEPLTDVSVNSVNTDLRALNLEQATEEFGREAVEAAWLQANNEAFDWHPEQGGWDLERLHRGMEAEWFDPRDVWFLYDGEELAGFHWTKWHGDGLGEVYVVGLASVYRGKGLGGPLLAVGLRSLVQRGATKVILYVEADNKPAVNAYDKLGFSVIEDHVVWARPAGAGSEEG